MPDWVEYVRAILEITGIGTFLFFFSRALKTKIQSLNDTVRTMDKRLLETEKMADTYKKFTIDMPDMMDKFTTTVKLASDSEIKEMAREKNELVKQIETESTAKSESDKKLFHERTKVLALKILLRQSLMSFTIIKMSSFVKYKLSSAAPKKYRKELLDVDQIESAVYEMNNKTLNIITSDDFTPKILSPEFITERTNEFEIKSVQLGKIINSL